MKVDLHLHSRCSPDAVSSLEELIEACQRRGLDALALTDHNTIRGALELRRIAPFPVIVGEEIRTTRGELIGYFLQEEVPAGLTPEETIHRIREQGGLISVPHPFCRYRRSRLDHDVLAALADQVDMIEVFNSRNVHMKDNRLALKFAQERGKLFSAGSDAHTPGEVGNSFVEVEDCSTPAAFLAGLQTRRWTGHRALPTVHLVSRLAKSAANLVGSFRRS